MLRGLALATALGSAAAAQAAPAPSLEGDWTTSTLTPYARPADFKTLIVPEAEAAAYERQRRGKPPEAAKDEVGGDETDWWETDEPLMRVRGQARSSWIVSPADGRVPFTAEAQAGNRARQARTRGDFSGPEVRPDGERCLAGIAPPLSSGGANDGFQIVQTASAVVIRTERANSARIVRLGGAHAPASIRTRDGESVGWWEGATLVVDTRNFADATTPPGPGEDRSTLRVIERFTRTGPKELHYAFFLSNPGRYKQPVQGETVFRATKAAIYEVACHEGNYALTNILAGARVQEADAK
ncbi:hypothetical protein [Phenylobacterium sp.]|jgi:hypothetical protein|uniref:hypothetical protein n=1 Tax=Phenylobacterium sp. TaxID=1871053 RepID=UPI002F93D1B6